MTTTTTRYPVGALAGVLVNGASIGAGAGTCLVYGPIIAHEPATDPNRSGRVTIRRPDGTEHTVSDHGDYVEVHELNAVCAKCRADVWRNPYRGAWEGIPDVDATGSTRCPKGGTHGRINPDLPSKGVNPPADLDAAADDPNAHLELHTRALLAEARVNRKHLIATEPDRPWTGEWLRFADGEMRRIAHVWEWGQGPERVQPASDSGSFHLTIGGGSVSHSGGLDSGIKPEHLTLSEDRHGAWFWIWKNGRAAAHNGADVRIADVRVWDVAPGISPRP